MSNQINNIDLDKIQKTIESGQRDRQFLKKPVKSFLKCNPFDKFYTQRLQFGRNGANANIGSLKKILLNNKKQYDKNIHV